MDIGNQIDKAVVGIEFKVQKPKCEVPDSSFLKVNQS